MCVCVRACVRACVCVHVRACACAHVFVCASVRIYAFVYVVDCITVSVCVLCM